MMGSSQNNDEELILQSPDKGGRTLRLCKNEDAKRGLNEKGAGKPAPFGTR
jgi:hypothetical protein